VLTSDSARVKVAAVVLAGGRATRMGGIDKGLQTLQGKPLARIALERIQAQRGVLADPIGINANRNHEVYASWGVPVWADAASASIPAFSGPLLGFLAGLKQAGPVADYLLTVPCDSPRFPLDLLQRLLTPLLTAQAGDAGPSGRTEVVVALAPELQSDGTTRLRPQPVFCLLHTSLRNSLVAYLEGGGRKIDTWLRAHRYTEVSFNEAHDDPLAFANANTLDELHALERA
jgi:molybdopterin-guanine dinucleotide biosynthesis protein A